MWEVWNHLSWPDIWIWLISSVVVAIVTEATVELITTSYLLAFFRDFLARRAFPLDPQCAHWYWAYLHKLATCGYCASVWVSLWALTLPGGWCGIYPWDNLLFKVLVVHRLSNLYHTTFELLRRGRVQTVDLRITIVEAETGESNDSGDGPGIGAPGETSGT